MTQPKPQTILERARALIERHWSKGAYYREEDDSYCALGALNVVISRSKDKYNAASSSSTYALRVQQYLEDSLPLHSYRSVVVFNDGPKTTKEDVLALYDRAITLAKADKG